MGFDKGQIPLEEFRRLITTLPARELARVPPERLPDHIPIDLIENAPPDVASTIETLIFKRQSSVMHDQNLMRDKLGADGATAYDLASQPRLTPTIRGMLERLRDIQTRLRQNSETTPSPRETLDELEALAPAANDIGDHYRRLLGARRALRRIDAAGDPDLLSLLKKIDRKLRRRCALHRKVLDQYHAQKLLVTIQIMRDYHDRIIAQREEREAHTERRERLRQRLAETRRKIRRFPTNIGFRHLAEQLENELASLEQGQRLLPIPLGEEDLELWLDAIVDHRLLRDERESMARLQQRAETLYRFLLRHYYQLQTDRRSGGTLQPRHGDADGNSRYDRHARDFLTQYFHSRMRSGDSPYWVPEIYRLERLRKLESRMIGL